MKNLLCLLPFNLFLVSCSTVTKESNDTDFTNKAADYLVEYTKTCKSDQKKLWGKSLCVPMVILDRNTMTAVTTKIDPKGKFEAVNGVWKGRYEGPQVYANTSFQWENETWSMVLWPLPDERESRIELLMHEAWHSIQSDLGLPANSLFLDHLDTYEGRLLIRLEWQALLMALNEEQNRNNHLQKALYFRNLRFKKFPSAKEKEKALDFNEGLAAYTGLKFRSGGLGPQLDYLSKKLEDVPKVPSLARSSSYYTGPLYGLLLDSKSSGWKSELNQADGLGALAQAKFEITPLKSSISLASLSSAYKYKEIEAFEKKRKIDRDQKVKKYLSLFSQKDSVRIVPTPGSPSMFDPRKILALSEKDFIYVYYETSDKWGTLKVDDGARIEISKDKSTISLGPLEKIDKKSANGVGWSIELNENWTLRKNSQGFYEPTTIK